MELGVIGLGRMGANLVRRLRAKGHDCTVFDRDPEQARRLAGDGAAAAADLADLVSKLAPPRALWLMLPAGAATEETILALAPLLARDDIVVDGGNGFFKDDVRRAAMLRPCGIRYLDVGTSGGVWGRERGYCLMIGGESEAVARLEPIFAALAPGMGDVAPSPGRRGDPAAERGYLHCGPHGAGHFVKMVHNGIEYGLMQAYAEGFDILKHAAAAEVPEAQRYRLDLGDIAELWRRGSVITSWLLDLAASALAEDRELAGYTGVVQDSGEGRWTVMTAIEEAVPAEVLSAALYARFRSRQAHTFAEKLLSAMRKGFGGHVEPAG
jgi:6-phosphogluconate dehydrogenase